MIKLLILGLLAFFIFFALKAFLSRGKRKEIYPYRKRQYLLTIPERRFFEWLNDILPEDVIVIPQVVMSNILETVIDRRYFWQYQNKINRKTLDFVIFALPYLEPLVAIEYDDRSHDIPERQARDFFVNNALRAAGIEILRVRHSNSLNYRMIKKQILAALKNASFYG